MYWKSIFGLLGLVASFPLLAAGEPPRWITEGPYVDEESIAFEVPVDVIATMIFIEVEVGGEPRRFVFDTGSPSMMSAALAKELGLEVVDKRKGRDSHSAIVETDIVQADLTLGGTTFRKVPVFVADFPETAQCLFDGVVGSEVLPLCAWQIDLPDSALRCHTNVTALDHVETAKRQTLHDFGYPHTPILDIQLAENARSKAMFDTGSPEYLAISPPDFEGARRNDGVDRTIQGKGSIGGSIGGRAPQQDQLMVELKNLSVDNVSLGSVGALLRESSPSLLGASLLEHFVVTLDASKSAAYFDQYREGPFARSSYGFSVDFQEDIRVSLVWEESPAAAAGLRVGERVTTINGQPASASCEGIRDAMRAMSEGNTIELERENSSVTLGREITILDD